MLCYDNECMFVCVLFLLYSHLYFCHLDLAFELNLMMMMMAMVDGDDDDIATISFVLSIIS